MLWELLLYVGLPLFVLMVIRKRRRKDSPQRIRKANGDSVLDGFKEEIVLITGAAQGIGKHLAYKFGERGAKLVLWDINETKVHSARQELEDTGYEVFAYVVDCADRDAVYQAAAKVKEEVGMVTVLVNNAGTYSGKTILQMEDEDMERTMKINLMASFYTVRAFLPSMLEKNHGHIVAIASAAAFTPFLNLGDYCTSKAALVSFMKVLRAEILFAKKSGVFITCVCPGSVDTGFGNNYSVPISFFKSRELRKMTVEFAVDRIMKAIANREFVVIFPRGTAFFAYFATVLPNLIISMLTRRAKNHPAIDLATGRT